MQPKLVVQWRSLAGSEAEEVYQEFEDSCGSRHGTLIDVWRSISDTVHIASVDWFDGELVVRWYFKRSGHCPVCESLKDAFELLYSGT